MVLPLRCGRTDFDKIDTNIYLLELELSKSPSDNSIKNYKTKAPVICFWGMVQVFINNYNYKYEEDPSVFRHKPGAAWLDVLQKPQSLWQTKKY